MVKALCRVYRGLPNDKKVCVYTSPFYFPCCCQNMCDIAFVFGRCIIIYHSHHLVQRTYSRLSCNELRIVSRTNALVFDPLGDGKLKTNQPTNEKTHQTVLLVKTLTVTAERNQLNKLRA